MKDAHVFIIHGYTAAPESHWFPWLKNKIEQQGGKASVLRMPDSGAPKAGDWNALLKKEIPQVDGNTYLIGHSLGCITALNFVSGLPQDARIGGFICVSGFSENLPNIPALDAFTDTKYDIDKVKKIISRTSVILALDDGIVAPELTRNLAHELDAPLHPLAKGGHFLGSDGFTEFPLVWDELQSMLPAR